MLPFPKELFVARGNIDKDDYWYAEEDAADVLNGSGERELRVGVYKLSHEIELKSIVHETIVPASAPKKRGRPPGNRNKVKG